MKIFAAGIATETNTFSPLPTGLEDFTVERGANAFEPGHVSSFNLHEIWGRRAQAHGAEFVSGLMAWAQPSGITVKSVYEALRDEMLQDLRAAMPVDIVLLMLHGAMIAQGYEDCEEDIIRRVRAIVGANAVIGVELDLHCHLSESKIAAADLVLTYKEYPHVDVNERAAELLDLAVHTHRGQIRPTLALFDCRMVGIYPTTREPMQGLVRAMRQSERRKGVLSVSLAHGYPFADVPEAGAKMLVATDRDPALAKDLAEELGLQAYALRAVSAFDSLSLPLEEALLKALSSSRTPVVVADQSDNPGGGAPGDATFALRWLLEHDAREVGLAILYDPQVVKLAHKAGIGSSCAVRLGGKLGPSSGQPLDIQATVLAMRQNYVHDFPQHGGAPLQFPAGDVVALRCGGIDIVVSSDRCQCLSPSIFSDLGIDPHAKRALIVKSTQHFHGAFAPLAGEILYMAAPGAVAPDPRQIAYRRLDTRKRYPWVADPLDTEMSNSNGGGTRGAI